MAIFSLVYADEDLNTLFLQCFNYVLLPWDFFGTTPQRHKQKQLQWKESRKQNLDFVLWLMTLIYCILRFT